MFSLQIQSALARLEMWPKAFTDAFNLHKAQVRDRDKKERLTQEDFHSFLGGKKAIKIKSKYETLANDPMQVVDINTFAELRDYLLLLLVITASGQRCGAAGNLTVEEFEQGVEHPNSIFVTKTLHHKTAAGGQAKLLWDAELKKMSTIYLNVMRPIFANDRYETILLKFYYKIL